MGAIYGRDLRKLVAANKGLTQIIPANSSTHKHTRILVDSVFIKKYMWFIHPKQQSPEYAKAMKQVTSYLKNGKSTKDDAPDSLSGLSRLLRGMLSHLYN